MTMSEFVVTLGDVPRPLGKNQPMKGVEVSFASAAEPKSGSESVASLCAKLESLV